MFNQQMVKLGTQRSVIREIFEFGNQRAREIGRENVFDFSIGNPNVPAPKEVQAAILEIVGTLDPVEYHSYTSSQGLIPTRAAISSNLNRRFGTAYTADDVYLTCGASASLNITLRALIAEPMEEILSIAPYFPEYRFFVEGQGGKFIPVEPDLETFQIDFDKLAAHINAKTKAIIINSPNNPSGVVYCDETFQRLAELLRQKSADFGHPIYIISDEPYRELVYGNTKQRLTATYYDNTIIIYSWSKSLSLPGERIGYILTPQKLEGSAQLKAAIHGAARILGFTCAPSLFQKVIERCIDVEPDLTIYEKNRDLILDRLTGFGYEIARPDGAFYAFIKAPDGDSEAFCERAKKYNVLLVPGTGFGIPTHMRLSYCVSTKTIEKSLPYFELLMKESHAAHSAEPIVRGSAKGASCAEWDLTLSSH